MILVTWNMQGNGGGTRWNAVKKLLTKTEADVMLLQECGHPPGSRKIEPAPRWMTFRPPRGSSFSTWRVGSESRAPPLYMLHISWGRRNLRCSLAIVCATRPTKLLFLPNPLNANARPMIGVKLPYGDGSVVIGTIHAFSGSGHGNDAPGFVRRLDQRTYDDWLCGGDFNRQPREWGAGPPAGELWPPCEPTYPSSRKKFDYAISDIDEDPTGLVLFNFIASDHLPVIYEF